MMGTPEFPNLGTHCSVGDCNQIDFLPFSCDACKKVFCLEHRSYVSHQCPNASLKDVTVLICPLCAKGVRLVPKEDPNISWEHHVNTDCDPSNYQRTRKKKRCPVPGCKELLTFSNTVRCRDCVQEHCLKHRFGPDHKCPGPKKPASAFQFVNLLRKSNKSSAASQNSDATPWSSSFLNAASSVRATAESGVTRLSNATAQALLKAKDVIAQNKNAASPMEQCLQCPAKFHSVNALIEHVERSHNYRAQRHQIGLSIDVCPKCSKGFRDPVLLVEHVERDH